MTAGRTSEHAVVCVEGSLDASSSDLAEAFMRANATLAQHLDRLTNGGLEGDGWQVVSHDVVLVGEKTLTTLKTVIPVRAIA